MQETVSLAPERLVERTLGVAETGEPMRIEVRDGAALLAEFEVPLALPRRTGPEPVKRLGSAPLREGWQHYLFARFEEAEAQFRQAAEAGMAEAHAGLAFVALGRDSDQAIESARAALRLDPDLGMANYVLAVALLRQGQEPEAMDAAWQAALDPKIAVAARALIGRILIRQGAHDAAAAALSASGPWPGDTEAMNLLAVVRLAQGKAKEAVELAQANLRVDPLDGFARSVLWRIGMENSDMSLASLVTNDPHRLLDLVIDYLSIGHHEIALRLLREFHLQGRGEAELDPTLVYWAAWLAAQVGEPNDDLRLARSLPSEGIFPHRLESEAVLRWALHSEPTDGKAALYLGHLLFAWGRHAEGRSLWEQAAGLGVEQAVASRALGMASHTLDRDSIGAASWLRKAQMADPSDAIVARDLTRVLFELAEREESADRKRELTIQAQEILHLAFEQGRGRSDFVALLARAQNRLGQYAETARLLDSVRITIWEGAHEAHDLFVEAHMALGETHLEAGRAGEALREFDRALEYPENLATGRLETAREAHIQYQRGRALEALGRRAEAVQAWRKAADEPGTGNAEQDEARRLAQAALVALPP
jgi:tetratricopeptide (TPR) repeat protein